MDQITRHLEFLADTLPSKSVDAAAGRNRFAVYVRLLRSYSDAALSFMSQQACRRLDWFPTPHQCLDILREYPTPASDRETARIYCQAYWQNRMHQFHSALIAGPVDQATIDAQPEQWKRIAENQGYLRWQGGKFVQRGLRIGNPTPSPMMEGR